MDQVIEYVKDEVLKPGLGFEEDGEEDHVYLMLDVCDGCEAKEINAIGRAEYDEVCEECQLSEYIEIDLDNDVEPDFRLITGENLFTDLTENVKVEG